MEETGTKRAPDSAENEQTATKKPKSKNFSGQPQSSTIQPGMTGFLFSCQKGKEALAVREAHSLLNEFAAKFYPYENIADSNLEKDSVEAEIQRELDELKRPKSRPFVNIKVDAPCLIFIQVLHEKVKQDVAAFTVRMIHDLRGSDARPVRLRYLSRIQPLQSICFANMNDTLDTVKDVCEKYISGDEKQTFSLLYRHRSNDRFDRDELTQNVVRVVTGHRQNLKVDLKEPQLTVSLEVYKNICGVSVLREFNQLKKYNLQSI